MALTWLSARYGEKSTSTARSSSKTACTRASAVADRAPSPRRWMLTGIPISCSTQAAMLRTAHGRDPRPGHRFAWSSADCSEPT